MRTMKRAAAVALSVVMLMTSGVTAKAAVTDAQPAKDVSEAKLNWNVKVGELAKTEYPYDNNTLSRIKLVGNYIYAADDAQHRILKVDKKTGKVVKEHKYYDESYVQHYVGNIAYGDGKIYTEYTSGRVQAFDANTLESLWITETTGNAVSSELTYDNGKLYFGTHTRLWNEEEATNTTYSYYTVDTKDEDTTNQYEEKKITKLVDSEGGTFNFKKAVVVGNYIVISDTAGKIFSINKKTNEVVDEKQFGENYDGNANERLRGNMAYDKTTQRIFFMVGTNDLYGVKISSDGKFERTDGNVKVYKTGYSATTPEVYNGKVYVSGTKGNPFNDPGYMAVVDVKSYKVNYTVELPGYSQAEPTIVKTANNSVSVYFTVNNYPGAVYVINDSKDTKSAKLETIYVPSKEAQNGGCQSPVVVDTDGTIYYSNDSKYIFKVSRQAITKTQTSTRSVKLTWKKKKSAKGYVIYAKAGKGKYKKLTMVGKTTKKTVTVKSGTSYKFKVKPYKYTKKKGKKVKKYYKAYAAKAKYGSKTVKVTYKNVKGYTSYRIDMKVGNGSYKKVLTSKKTGTLTLTYTQKKAKVGKSYKFRLVGIKTVNGKSVEKTIK